MWYVVVVLDMRRGQAWEVVAGLTQSHPPSRWTAAQCMSHAWFVL
jgi:hypothetical protein